MTMVDDFDDADALVQSMFSPEIFMPKSWSDFDKRWASLNRVGPDFVLELMEASTAEEDQASPLPKFARRFGQHLHSFVWYVDTDDHVPTFRRLRAGGVRVAGPSGLLPDDIADDDVPTVLFTHPKDTFGQIELSQLPSGHADPVFDPEWNGVQEREEQPLGILRVSHFTNAVDDLDRAKQVFGDLLGGTVFHEESDDVSERAYVLVGTDSVVELARPRASGTRLADDLAANGPLPHRGDVPGEGSRRRGEAPRGDRHDGRRAHRRHRRPRSRDDVRRAARASPSCPICRTTRACPTSYQA